MLLGLCRSVPVSWTHNISGRDVAAAWPQHFKLSIHQLQNHGRNSQTNGAVPTQKFDKLHELASMHFLAIAAVVSWKKMERVLQFAIWCNVHLRVLDISTSRAGQAGGGSFKEKNYKFISQRKTLPMECAQGDQPLRCPNRVFWVNEPSAVPWWWCGDLFWCGWLQGEMN